MATDFVLVPARLLLLSKSVVADGVVDLRVMKEGLGNTVVAVGRELITGLEVAVTIEGEDGPAKIAVDEDVK